MTRIAPSILSADFADLAAEVAKVEQAANLLHIDVMDGHFVPNITLGPPVIKSLRPHSQLYFDCHLMITNPGDYLENFKEAGADGCSVHVEVGDTKALIGQMRELGLDPGLVINPQTEFEQYEEFLSSIDMLVIMSVNPGFGGQSFMREVLPKMKRTRQALDERGLDVRIEIDGGIDVDTAPEATSNGADTLVAGSAIFAQPDPARAAQNIREAVKVLTKEHS